VEGARNDLKTLGLVLDTFKIKHISDNNFEIDKTFPKTKGKSIGKYNLFS
jgi:hypothetical protein